MNKIILPKRAFILAAGLGTRLRPYTDHCPKPMVQVAGQSLISRTLDKLQDAGISEVVVNLHYMADILQAHLEGYAHKNSDMQIHFSLEKDILGTGGGIKNALHYFKDEPFYVIAGDSLWIDNIELSALEHLAQHWDPKKMDILTLVQPLNHMHLTKGVGDYDLDENGLMKRSHKQEGQYMWTNIRLNAPHIYNDIKEKKFSFLDIMDACEEKKRFYGLIHNGDWHHISTPKDLETVNAALLSEKNKAGQMDNAAHNHIYNIRAGLPFSKTLAQYLLQITADKPETLTQYKILLPTRRACRILRETFLNITQGKPLLLPQLTPLGDVDEEDLSLMMFGNSQEFLTIPKAIAPLKRQILLAKLISSIPEFVQGQDHALHLAAALSQFIDQVSVEELHFSDLHKIVPEEFAAHWKITLNFLKIISEYWPKILQEHGVIDAVERRNLLLQALVTHWKNTPPTHPVIAAGSTGSIPAAGQLLAVIARMETGRIILPGLDTKMDDESWNYITESHPQHSLKTLLKRIDIDRAAVQDLKIDAPDEISINRALLASEIMRPAQTTHHWKDLSERHDITPMLQNLQYFSCTTQQEEAALIALIMRESLEHKTHITALITPDRTLARRVSALCRRWNIDVDDSAGENLTQTRLGRFIALSLHAMQNGFDVIACLSLLKISLCRFGQDEHHYNKMLTTLEVRFLRQGNFFSSFDALQEKITEKKEYQALGAFMEAFHTALKPMLYYAHGTSSHKFSDILKTHLRIIETLATTHDQTGSDILWRGDVGESAALFFTELSEQAHVIEDVTYAEYEQILNALMRNVTVRSAYGVHPRLLILGQLEARLSDADCIILGGLNEGVWPPDPRHDPWMSRPMRTAFGLPGNDQAIGIAAHDFVQGFCAQNVILTRAEKLEGSPTVRARWIDRLDTVLQSCGKKLSDLAQTPYLEWARQIDHHNDFKPYNRPEPRPPVSTRPNAASVTKIDLWMKDPYAIYMHYVLNLRKMQPLLQDNDAALRGTILHEILERFTRQNPDHISDDAEKCFINIAQDILATRLESPELMHYWWPRFLNIATWFVEHEKNWRAHATFLESEIKGNIDLHINDEGYIFNLYGTADRIDRLENGYALIDYKTGGVFFRNSTKKRRSAPTSIGSAHSIARRV